MTPQVELQDLVQRARSAASAGRHDEAAELARETLARAPRCLAALRVLAWAELERGADEALAAFRQCAEVDPEDALAELGMALWHGRRGERERAAPHVTRAWELDPDNQRIRRAVVALLAELPDSKLAEGIMLVRARRFEDAVNVLQALEERDAAAQLALATAWWHLRDRRRAHALASAILLARPWCVKAMLLLVAIENEEGHTLRARELATRAQEVDPGFVLYGQLVREIGLAAVLERHAVRGNLAVAAR